MLYSKPTSWFAIQAGLLMTALVSPSAFWLGYRCMSIWFAPGSVYAKEVLGLVECQALQKISRFRQLTGCNSAGWTGRTGIELSGGAVFIAYGSGGASAPNPPLPDAEGPVLTTTGASR